MGGCPPPFAGWGLSEPEAPVPISAVKSGLPPIVTVTYDRPLTADPALDVGNWYAYVGGWLYTCTAAAASGNQVVVTLAASDPSINPDSVTYDPPPYDVLSSIGVPAAAMPQYPVT